MGKISELHAAGESVPVASKKATLNLSEKVKKDKKEKHYTKLSREWLLEQTSLTKRQVDIIEFIVKSDYEFIDMFAAKSTAKTLTAFIATEWLHQLNPVGLMYGFRKNKDQASEKLGDYYFQTLAFLKGFGYTPLKSANQVKNKIYWMKHQKQKTVKTDSHIIMGSLEDYTGATDGSSPRNAGFYFMRFIDELMDKKDIMNPEKIPDEHHFNSVLDHIDDNLKRWVDTFYLQMKHRYERMEVKRELPKKPIMKRLNVSNNWGKHPRAIMAEKLFPQNDYVHNIIGYTFDELVGNYNVINKLIKSGAWREAWTNEETATQLWKSEDHEEHKGMNYAITRQTKFSNPLNHTEENIETILKQIEKGFKTENMEILARMIGTMYVPTMNQEDLVYNIRKYNERTLESLSKEGWYPVDLTFGVDVDTSRVFTITPTLRIKKDIKIIGGVKQITALHTAPQIEITSLGSGAEGELHVINGRKIAKEIRKVAIELSDKYETIDSAHLIVDDNRKHYLKYILDGGVRAFISSRMGAIKQGHYDIQARQDMVEASFNDGLIFLDPANQKLIQDFKECVRVSRNNTKRKTEGSTNYLDRIDSFEYSLYRYIGLMLKAQRKVKKIKL